jgi:MoaA/NifB/PqqE/SkfB family radical SAM enzyme
VNLHQKANPQGYLELAIMFARTCNIACRHCGIESSPQNHDRMTLEEARSYIVEAAAMTRFRKVTFTGGEPFLFQKEHLDLIELATGLALSTRAVTNGFWAANLTKGRKFLTQLKDAGLGELNFSADRFHLEFLDAAVLRNALELTREAGYKRIISFVTNEPGDPLDEFSRMYGIPRDDLADLRLYLSDLDKAEALKDRYIFVYAGGLIGLGRAAEYPAELKYVPFDFFPNLHGCGEVLNKPVIYPNGDFQACCCAGGKMSTFTVGNAKRESIPALYEKMSARSQFRFINTYGPKELFRVIADARPDLRRQSTFTSICELCVRATDHLSPTEIDDIVEGALVARTLGAMGFAEIMPPPPSPAALFPILP